MNLHFERDEARLESVGSVEGRPEAVRHFPDVALRAVHIGTNPMKEWIEELKEYLGEEVETVTWE